VSESRVFSSVGVVVLCAPVVYMPDKHRDCKKKKGAKLPRKRVRVRMSSGYRDCKKRRQEAKLPRGSHSPFHQGQVSLGTSFRMLSPLRPEIGRKRTSLLMA
jgi:hypothetical protein